MRLRLKDEELAHLKAYLEQCPDSEYLSAREVVLDLYEIERPISINFVFVKGGIGIDGAAEMRYSDEERGYYMGDRIEDAETIRAALVDAGALPNS